MVAMLRGRWVEAETHFQSVRACGASDFELAFGALQFLPGTGRLQAAYTETQRAYELAPANPTAALAMAIVSALLERDDESTLWTDLAVDLGVPAHLPPIPLIRSQVARRQGHNVEAADQALLCLPPNIRDAAGRASLAEVFAGMETPGRRPAAITALLELESRAGTALEAGVDISIL